MSGKRLLIVLFISLVLALLFACEQPPGEITGRVTQPSGRGRSLKIHIVNASGKVVWEGYSNTEGTWYTGETIPPGKYTVLYLDPEGKPYPGTEQEVVVTSGGVQTLEQSF